MKRTTIIGVLALLAIVVAACSPRHGIDHNGGIRYHGGARHDSRLGTTEGPGTTTAGDPLAEFGETIAADQALVDKALGPVELSAEDSWNIVLASIARADQDLDQATIDKAMECWSNQECQTGNSGTLVMGYADGGGDTVNVWRAVSHMEAILQALTYDEIGTIVSTAADFNADPAVHANDIRFLIQRGVDFIVGYPDVGIALAEAVSGHRGRDSLCLVLSGIRRAAGPGGRAPTR